MSPPLEALRAELGADLPTSLTELPDDAVVRLLDKVRAARTRQSAALEVAIDEGLEFVPALLRRAVRKALFGGGK